MEKKLKVIIFNQPLHLRQIPYFRGAMIKTLTPENILLHNHLEEKLRYSYPLVQYKTIERRAAIIAIGEGMDLFSEYYPGKCIPLNIGNESTEDFQVQEVREETLDFIMGKELLNYEIRNWLPLNQHNYSRYKESCGLMEKIEMLQSILTGNILSAAKGIGIHLDNQLECVIRGLHEPRLAMMKDVKMMTFHAKFAANILLPDYIGLGKSGSKGYGILKMI